MTLMKAVKAVTQKSMRTSISMPAHMFVKALEKQQKHGYPTFSDYIQNLVRKDALQEAR